MLSHAKHQVHCNVFGTCMSMDLNYLVCYMKDLQYMNVSQVNQTLLETIFNAHKVKTINRKIR